MDEQEDNKPYIFTEFMNASENVQRWHIYKLLLKIFMLLKSRY